MTYFEVLRRLLELLYLVRKGDWTDPSYKRISSDFMVRTLERFDNAPEITVCTLSPYEQLDYVASKLPHLTRHFLLVEDADYFVDLGGRRGQKPVPFIPVLDSEFLVRFKKDPLWQAENLDSTYHGDVGRVCILCGPMAVQYCKDLKVPVGTFLNSINQGYLDREAHLGVPPASYCPTSSLYEEHELVPAIGASYVNLEGDTVRLREDSPNALDNDRWLLLLGSRLGSRGGRFFGTRKLLSNGRAYTNPIRRIFSARPGALVRFFGKNESCYTGAEICSSDVQPLLADARVLIDGNTITAIIVNRHTKDGHVKELQLSFEYDKSFPYAPITEVMHDRTDRIHDFYQSVLFGPTSNRRVGVKTRFMRHSPVVVSRERVLAWMGAVDGQGLGSPDPLGQAGEVPIEYATIIVWPAIWRHLFTWDWDISRLLHMRTTVQLTEGQQMLSVGDEVVLTSRFTAVHNRDSGIKVVLHMVYERNGIKFLDMTFTSMMLGQRLPESESFELSDPVTWMMNLRTEADVQALLAKPWFRPVTKSGALRIGHTLVFELRRETSPRDGIFDAKTSGEVWVQNTDPPKSDDKVLCAQVEQIININRTDPVTDFMTREAVRIGIPVRLPTEKILRTKSGQGFKITTPDNSIEYADVGGDYNAIHTITTFARFSGFQVPVYHGNHTVALVLQLIRREIPGATGTTLSRYDCDFPAVVFPGDTLNIAIKHIAMDKGRKVLSFSCRREDSEELVLAGEITLDAPPSAFLFTGQGSQFAGMGLDMISESRPSRLVWGEADKYFEHHWGFSISDIVRHNPKELTVNFCGRQGIQVLQNYFHIQEMLRSCSSTCEIELYNGLHAGSRSYTFRNEDGLLSMTQFAQPAIFVVEKAAFEHLKHLNRVPTDSCFADHSLGEFAALGCMTSIMSMEAALRTVFIRGALMQAAVPRDSMGRSGFAMVAVDPSRIGKDCQEKHILSVVNEIAESTGLLLEMVNFNVRGHQYVCAGEKRGIDILRRVTDELHQDRSGLSTIECTKLLVAKHATSMAVSASDITLIRGKATVPLKGIDVPFHSSLLAPMRDLFRRTLIEGVDKKAVNPEVLVGKWIPNVTGKPFAVDSAYLQLVARLTGSVRALALTAELK